MKSFLVVPLALLVGFTQAATPHGQQLTPQTATYGDTVTFSWNFISVGGWPRCRLTGLPGISAGSSYIDDFTGSYTFIAEGPAEARLECTEVVGSNKFDAELVRTVSTTSLNFIESESGIGIHISYPRTVFVGDTHNFNVTTSNADSCTVKYSELASAIDIGTSHHTILGYSRSGEFVQSVTCEGLGTVETETNTVLVYNKVEHDPVIQTFSNGDVVNGSSKLYWGTSYTDSCELSSNGVSNNVAVNEIVGYPVSIPFGGRTFVLTCQGSGKAVSKQLNVPRPPIGGPGGGSDVLDPRIH